MIEDVEKISGRLISIIMPVYNAEKTIVSSIQSVMEQSYKNWELIVIDDGSVDRSGLICDKMASHDSRIKVYHLENSGVSQARNWGISHANGDLICFIDSDDILLKDAMKTISIMGSSIDLLIFGYALFPSDIVQTVKQTKSYQSIRQFTEDFDEISQNHLLNCVWNKCFKKSIIDRYHCQFPNDISMGEDLLFVLAYIQKCRSIRVIDRVLYQYSLENSESLSKNCRTDAFKTQKLLKEETDNTFNRHEKVTSVTSYIFVNHIIEEMKKIVYTDKLKSKEKIKLVKKWIEDDYFNELFNTVKARLKQGRIVKIIVSFQSTWSFYLYFTLRKHASTMKQSFYKYIYNTMKEKERE